MLMSVGLYFPSRCGKRREVLPYSWCLGAAGKIKIALWVSTGELMLMLRGRNQPGSRWLPKFCSGWQDGLWASYWDFRYNDRYERSPKDHSNKFRGKIWFVRLVDPPFLGPVRRHLSWGSVLLWTSYLGGKKTKPKHFKSIQKRNSECDQGSAKHNLWVQAHWHWRCV